MRIAQFRFPIAVKTKKTDTNAIVGGRIVHVRRQVSDRKCGSKKMYADPYDKRRRGATLTGGAHGTYKEDEKEDTRKKNGRRKRERTDNHEEPVLRVEGGGGR